MSSQFEAVPQPRALSVESSAFLVCVGLGLVLEFLMSHTYSGLIVETFGGARNAHIIGDWAVAFSYFTTALAAGVCGWYCARRLVPSRVIVVVHLVAVVIPLQALVAADFELAHSEFAAAVGFTFIAAVLLADLLADVELPILQARGRAAAGLMLLLITLYVYGSLVTHGGLSRISLDLTLVYEVREQFLEDAAPFAGYLIPWQGYVLNPCIILIGVRRRSWLLVGGGLALQMALFAMTGFRAFLLSPVLMIALYHVGTRRQLTLLALFGAMAVIILSGAIYALTNEPLIPSLLVYRLLFIPAELHFWYYDFFATQAQPLLQLSQSALSAFFVSPYPTPIAEVIGWKYMGSAASANVGMFGDAFANFGFLGCAVFGVVFALVLKAVDAAGRHADPRVAAGLVGVPAFQLVNSGLLTTLATHGLALTIIALWVLSGVRRSNDRNFQEKN